MPLSTEDKYNSLGQNGTLFIETIYLENLVIWSLVKKIIADAENNTDKKAINHKNNYKEMWSLLHQDTIKAFIVLYTNFQ